MCIILGSFNIFDLWTLDVTLIHVHCLHPFAFRCEHSSNLFGGNFSHLDMSLFETQSLATE